MRFVMIPAPTPGSPPPSAEQPFDQELFKAYMKYNEDMHLAGVLVVLHVRLEQGVIEGRVGGRWGRTRGGRWNH